MTRPALYRKHDDLVNRLDTRFRFIHGKYADQMSCGRGCAQCCHGLFDISLPDALRVARAFGMLPQEIRSAAAKRSSVIQNKCKNFNSKNNFHEIDAMSAKH